MKLVYSTYASEQLENILYFLTNEQGVSFEKAFEIRQKILDKADLLLVNPKLGQEDEYFDKLLLQHRRLIVGTYKIIYLIEEDTIYIVDIFDTRQDPKKMKG
ncbi:MAG: type II toxin-antitoxin system RelE/ParE family toxin [Flammeovirgaceae bacterium]